MSVAEWLHTKLHLDAADVINMATKNIRTAEVELFWDSHLSCNSLFNVGSESDKA